MKNMAMAEGSFFKSNTFLLLAAAALFSGVASLLAQGWRNSRKQLQSKISELEAALQTSMEQRVAERKGRIRAQQALRKALVDKDVLNANGSAYPMTPIGFIESCFSTSSKKSLTEPARNGTPRQPLLVPLARACLALSPGGVPSTALDGLAEYSHCWLLYVFHANTDLPHIWKQPMHKDFKAKVRVPRLDGGKLGVFATRSPHRPCPIGLTVAKVEGVSGRMLLLSGADLVDGTPVLDVKPYLPYCDSVAIARAPSWVTADGVGDPLALASVEFSKDFVNDLFKSWEIMGKQSMYSGPHELQKLIEQVLSRDIRSLRQRRKPHNSISNTSDDDEFVAEHDICLGNCAATENFTGAVRTTEMYSRNTSSVDADFQSEIRLDLEKDREQASNLNSQTVVYRVILEGISIAYTIESGCVVVQGAKFAETRTIAIRECNYGTWTQVVGPVLSLGEI